MPRRLDYRIRRDPTDILRWHYHSILAEWFDDRPHFCIYGSDRQCEWAMLDYERLEDRNIASKCVCAHCCQMWDIRFSTGFS